MHRHLTRTNGQADEHGKDAHARPRRALRLVPAIHDGQADHKEDVQGPGRHHLCAAWAAQAWAEEREMALDIMPVSQRRHDTRSTIHP